MEINEAEAYLAKLRNIEEVRERLKISKILGSNYKSKIKIRIVHAIPHFWNSIQTIAEHMNERTDLELKIIMCPVTSEDAEKLKFQMQSGHFKYVFIDDYDVESDKPDIIVFNIAHTDVLFKLLGGIALIRENSKYIAVIPYDNSVKFESADRMERYYDSLKELRPDIFIVSKPVYRFIGDKYANTIQMDSPKFDIIYRKLKSENDEKEIWEKLNKKKTILWTTVHGHCEWTSDCFFKACCFDIYIKDVLNYFRENEDIALIFRPHPAYIDELVNMHKIWTEDDLSCFKDYFGQSNNLVWDDSMDYSYAFAMSDALITDDGTGITLSYLPTRKPICILRRNRTEIYTGTLDVTKNYYKAHDFDELKDYFEMIKSGDDPLYEKRMHTVNEYVPIFDGRNGERIADKIIDDFCSKYM